jgi:hypothetical protein
MFLPPFVAKKIREETRVRFLPVGASTARLSRIDRIG